MHGHEPKPGVVRLLDGNLRKSRKRSIMLGYALNPFVVVRVPWMVRLTRDERVEAERRKRLLGLGHGHRARGQGPAGTQHGGAAGNGCRKP